MTRYVLVLVCRLPEPMVCGVTNCLDAKRFANTGDKDICRWLSIEKAIEKVQEKPRRMPQTFVVPASVSG